MNDKQKELYSYLKSNGLTDLSGDKFFSAYSDPSKSKEIHAYLKKNGLTDLDANAFHVAYFSPVKKKSITGSQSVQKKKPTSSATMPSWMQSSLEQSSKKEQPKKPTGPQVIKSSQQESSTAGVTKKDVQNIANMGVNPMGSAMGNVQPKKQEERDFDIYYGYPGQEKNEYRISNGRWQRKYGEKWVEVSNQGSINSLTKFFGKEKEILKEEVFTGFPGKEDNKYRVSELQNGQKVWEVQRAGQKDYTVIGDQGSIDALNRQFNKKVEYTENAQLKREAEINRRESASEDFKTVTGKLVGKESDEVAAYLRKMYGDRGFRFVPTGFLTDNIEVISEATSKRETFVLDNFRDETDSAEALKLRKFLSENQQLGDYIDLEREEKKNAEEAIVGTRITQEDLNRQMGRLQGAGSQAQFELAEKQNTEENIKKGLSRFSTEVIEAKKTLIRADYDTKQRIDDLTRTAKTDAEMQEVAAIAVANKDEFVRKSGIDNEYLNDLNKAGKSLDQSFKTLNSDVEEFNRYIKENNITQDQLESDPELVAKKDELQVRYDQLIADAEDLDFDNKKLPFIQNQNARNAALYFAYNETRGSVIGGVWNGLLRGALSSLQTFRAVDKEGLDNLVETFGSYTTKEFTQSENRNDFSRALLSTSESLGAAAAAVLTGGLAAEGTVASKVLGFIPYFSTSYNEMKNEIDEIPGMDKVPWYKKEALSIAYGLGVGYLDKLSTDFQVKSKISNKIGRDLVLRSIAGLPKGATAEAIEMAIASNFKKDIAAGVIKIVAGQVVEGTTEGVQSAYGSGLKAAYDWMNDVDEFDTREWVSQAFEEAYYGALGGTIMSTPSTLIQGIKNGFGRLDPKDMELARKVIEDSNMRSMVITDIKAKLMSGEITKEEANAQMEAIKSSQELFGKIPDNLSAEDTSKAMDLIKERSKIEAEIKGKDKDLVAARTRRITAINNELKAISEDATKKSTEQEVTAEGGGVQREGVVEGQPEVGQGEGAVGQATTNETDLGNRPVEGRSKEEIDARVSELEMMLADDAASMQETGTGSLLPEAKTQIQAELETLKSEVPVEVTAETKEMPKAVETTDTKSYSDALAEAKSQMKEDGSGLDMQVSDVSKEEADAIVKEGGKIFMTEDGMAGAYVKKDGYMGGLFKNPKAKLREIGKVLQQARVAVGGKFMDAYATKLEDIYIKNGFRPVARMKFNPEYAPEGWDAPGSPLASQPDVVFFAYDPEGKYSKGDGQYVEDYDAAYEIAKNFDAKAANEADRLAAIIDKKATVSDKVLSKDEISKRVTLAQKALSVILPNVKFVIHDTDKSFVDALGFSQSGAYDPDTKTIHINVTKANKRTVSHEVFHAIIISKASSDKQLQKLTANMVKSVLKSLKQTGTNQDVIDYLEEFASRYDDDPSVMDEERLAELHGILGENMIELPLPTQNIIKRFLDRLAKMFGLKEMTDREAVEFMNTMSSKVETGKEITAKEFKGESLGRGIINIKSPRKSKFIDSLVFERFPTNKNTKVIENFDISNIDGQVAGSTLSDKLTAGRYKNVRVLKGEEVVDAEYIFFGGVGYPEVTGYVWAASKMDGVQKIIDSMVVSEDGYRYLIPAIMSNTSHMSNKNMTSITMEVFKEAIANNELNRAKFKEIVSKAFSNKKALKFKDGAMASISGNISATQMCDNLKSYILSSKMTFESRKDVLKSMVGDPKSGNPKFSTVGTYLSLATSLSEPMAKDADTHQVVVVIRTKGNLTAKKTDKKDPFYHESYGFHIESDQEIEVLHLDATYNLVDIIPEFTNNEGKVVSTEQELKEKGSKGWNINRILKNLGRTHGLAKYSARIVSPKKKSTESGVRKQKPLTTDKDVHPGYETALEALGETEAQIEQWRSENRVNQRQKRNTIVEKAAKDYYNEEITQEEYLDIVSKNQPIKPFKKVPSLPTLKEVVNSLDKNKVEKGIVGLTKNINDGEKVASRLDIPAYETYDTWVVSVHDGAKEDKSIAYGQTAVLKGVEFKSFSGPAIKMAMGVQNKTPIARMFGSWVNESPESVHARAEKLMNDPQWVQVGMNPFRHSWFYDKSDGMPLASAEEVVQVGALVLAKNPVKVSPSDPMFETKSSKGGKIRFQKPKVGETVEVYGSEAKVTAVDGDIITFKGKNVSGNIDYIKSVNSILNQPTPKEQVDEEVNILEEEMKPKVRSQRVDKASEKLQQLFERDNVPLSIQEAKEIVNEVYDWTTWYDDLKSYVDEIFGEYSEDVLSMLPLSSQAANSATTVALAIKNAELIYKGEKPIGVAEYYGYVTDFLQGKGIKSDKMYNFFKALDGDKDAIAVDMHVWSIIMGKNPDKKQVNPKNKAEFDRAKEFVNTLSSEMGLAPREVQAALWAANIMRTGGRPDSYEEYFKKQLDAKGLKERIENWRNQGYKPFSKVRREREAENQPNFRKQKASKQAEMIVKKGKEANLSDAGIREYMKRNGYTDRQATDAIQAYNDKQEGIFIDPEWSKLKKAAVVFKRKFLSARGLMPNTAFASNESREAQIAKSLNMAEKNIADFNRALKKVPKDQRDKIREDFDAYIRDKSAVLPTEFKKIADTMRAHIDSISKDLIVSGLIDEHLSQRVIDNIGSYLTRSYRVYDRSNWSKEVEENVKQKAINFLKIQYTPIAKDIAQKEGMDFDDVLDRIVTNKFNEILTKEGAENFITGGKIGSKNLSILKERQDIPIEIRMLMGEYTDPAQNYAKTILKMSALAANHHFLTEVKKNGTGVFLFEKNDARRPKGFDYMIAAEGSDTMNPLNGMYTTKEIKEEFEKQPAQLGSILELYMKALSMVKWGKTIGSLMTHAKNVFGNIGFVLLNGHWRVNEMGRAYKTVKNDLFSSDKDGLRDYMNKLIELGIVKQSAGIGELRAMFKDASWDEAMIERINKKTESKWEWVKSKFKRGTKFMEDMYQAEDDFFKIVAYENELSRYSKAMFGKQKTELTESERAEVDKVITEIVKNTYPTYSRIPELVNMIRRFPFIGNFISFQAESYRTAFNTAALSLDEIKSENPGVRQIGAQRLVGSLTYMTAKTAILSAFSNAVGMGAVGLLGYFTDDEEEKQKEDDVRKFLPEWSKNSDLLMLKASGGKIKYIDFSSSDPHGGINKAINSLLSGDKSVNGFINAMGSVIEPFIGEEMTTSAILAVKNNKNAYGKPIYNPEDTLYEKFKDISAHMLNVVQPGTVSTVRRAAESESLTNEIVGASTGMRIYDIDVAEQFGYSMIAFSKRIDDANRIYTSEVYNKDATEKSIADAKKRAEKAVTDIHAEIYDLYYSAVRLGADEDKLYDNLKSFGGMTKRTINYMFGQEDFYIKDKYPEEEEE